MSLSTSIDVKINVAQSNNGDINTAVSNTTLNEVLSLLDGVGLNQANQVWSDNSQLAISGVDSLDLAGVLTDAFGNAITFTNIAAIAVVADAGNGDNIEIGGNASAFASFLGDPTDVVIVPPGGMFLITAPDATGFPVTASTADILDITNADAAAVANYKIVLIGRE